jgi:coatomer protein complex subunit epsilon
MADDENLQIKNLFYAGNYNQCAAVAMGSQAPKNAQAKLDRQIIQWRALIAQGKPNLVISDIQDSGPPELQAVKLLALFKAAKTDSEKDDILENVKILVADNGNNPIVSIVAATVLCQTFAWNDALRVLSAHPKNLEWYAFWRLVD